MTFPTNRGDDEDDDGGDFMNIKSINGLFIDGDVNVQHPQKPFPGWKNFRRPNNPQLHTVERAFGVKAIGWLFINLQ